MSSEEGFEASIFKAKASGPRGQGKARQVDFEAKAQGQDQGHKVSK